LAGLLLEDGMKQPQRFAYKSDMIKGNKQHHHYQKQKKVVYNPQKLSKMDL